MRARILAAEGGTLIVLGAANALTGRYLASAILIALGGLAMACAWAFWATTH